VQNLLQLPEKGPRRRNDVSASEYHYIPSLVTRVI